MEQWLPRGTEVKANIRITKLLEEDANWQLYSSNTKKYVLAINDKLHDFWVNSFDISEEIFETINSYHVLCSTGDYIISSLDKGPYPTAETQIAAFSQSFASFVKEHKGQSLKNGIYVEEYSLLLPNIDATCDDEDDGGVVFGKWISRGVGVSAESFDRMAELVSWVPLNRLYRYVKEAGFKIEEEFLEERSEENKKLVKDEEFSLVGRPDLEKFFIDNIIDIVRNREQYEKMGIDFPGAVILHGLPGCGKTYAVDRLTEYLDWPRFDIDASSIASPYIHDTSKKIGEVFNAALKCAPSIIVIDEMEAFLSERTGVSEHHTEEVAEFLRRIPEAISNDVLIIAITNMIDNIDPAILRKGRFDHIIEVKMPQKEEIEALLTKRFKELPIGSDVVISDIAAKLDGHPMSDVAFMIREAGRFAVKNKSEYIDAECLTEAFKLIDENSPKKKTIGFRG